MMAIQLFTTICDCTPRIWAVKLANIICATGKKVIFWRNWDFCRFETFMLYSKYLQSFNFKKWTEIWKNAFSKARPMKNMWLPELNTHFSLFHVSIHIDLWRTISSPLRCGIVSIGKICRLFRHLYQNYHCQWSPLVAKWWKVTIPHRTLWRRHRTT